MRTLARLHIALASLVCCGSSVAQEPIDHARGLRKLEEKVAELERQLADLTHQLHTLRRDLPARPAMIVIPLKNVNAGECADVLRDVWRRTPGLVVHVLPKMRCIAVQADPKTTKDVQELVNRLEFAAESKREITGFSSRPDPVLIDEALRAIKKAQQEYQESQFEKRQGRWKLIAWEEEGLRIESEEVAKWKMMVKGHEWTLTRNGKETSRGTFQLDFRHEPHHEDCAFESNAVAATHYGIWAIEENHLISCYSMNARSRPEAFKSGPGRTLMVWAREQP